MTCRLVEQSSPVSGTQCGYGSQRDYKLSAKAVVQRQREHTATSLVALRRGTSQRQAAQGKEVYHVCTTDNSVCSEGTRERCVKNGRTTGVSPQAHDLYGATTKPYSRTVALQSGPLGGAGPNGAGVGMGLSLDRGCGLVEHRFGDAIQAFSTNDCQPKAPCMRALAPNNRCILQP